MFSMSLIGIPIGFYGYVFPGNINLMVVELFRAKKYQFLIFVLSLIIIFESIYCLGSLLLINALKLGTSFYQKIEWLAFSLVFLMGLWMIFETKTNDRIAQKNTVKRGMISIIFHPQQIPFWLIMGVIVNKYVPVNIDSFGLYQFVAFNALGTLLAMCAYMVVGSKLLNYLQLNNAQINRIMGIAYVLVAIISFLYSY